MTDKIMIDGVDVSKCLYRELRNAAYGKKHNHCKRFPNGCCSKNKNCYYKQLKRKEKECEKLENKYINLETDVINCLNKNILQDWRCDEDDNCPNETNLIPFMDFIINSRIDNLVATIDNLEQQLQSKTQECEKTKKRLEYLQKSYSKLFQRYENKGWSKEYDELKQQLKRKEKECERLKSKIEKIFIASSPEFDTFCDICEAKDKCNGCCCFEQIKEALYEIE